MLNENIKQLRKLKGLSQQELAIRLHVVRQTVSKWENGLSVPDAGMLIALANELDTTVQALLGEKLEKIQENDMQILSKKLETLNLQFAKNQENKRKHIRRILILICIIIIVGYIGFAYMQSSYLSWDFTDPELSVAGTILHGIEFLFVRLAPFIGLICVIGIIWTYQKK